MPRYRYTHTVPSTFVDIQTSDGSTWEPKPGDEIETERPVAHPHLELLPDKKPSVKADVPEE